MKAYPRGFPFRSYTMCNWNKETDKKSEVSEVCKSKKDCKKILDDSYLVDFAELLEFSLQLRFGRLVVLIEETIEK